MATGSFRKCLRLPLVRVTSHGMQARLLTDASGVISHALGPVKSSHIAKVREYADPIFSRQPALLRLLAFFWPKALAHR